MDVDKDILRKIYRYCAYQERCKSEVRQKLADLGVDHSDIESWIVHLEDERFLDETRFVHTYVRSKFNLKKWGKYKITSELKSRQVDPDLILKAIEAEIDDQQYYYTVFMLAESKLHQIGGQLSLDSKQKISFYLNQKGYGWLEIRETLKRLEKANQ